ncbi:MAG TPA: hypothetical protein VHU22_16745 [Xanthobacteraceae bacterium]|jgi:hypothetical protein|nr:hypothetical protein [Xanthobacteraceae bacterium]
MPYRPRAAREAERLRAAAAHRSATGSAMDRALAQIEAAFGDAAAVNDFKLRVERLFRLGPHHPALRARFRTRAEMLSVCHLTSATTKVERWWREERRVFQIASALGYGNRLSLEVLRELRLALRLMRFKRMHAEFRTIIAALRGDLIAEAAE